MKKTGFIILSAVIAVSLCGCSSSPVKTPDFECEQAYRPALEELCAAIKSPENAENLYDGFDSVREAAAELGAVAEDTIGYVFNDTDKDGKEELFIGCFETDGSADVNNEIYAAFSHDGDDLIPLFEKQKRNTFALTDTGTFYFYGSDGADFHIIAEYALTEDEGLVCKDFYFTYPKDGDIDKFAYYHNTSGQWDPAVSEEMDMTPEAFEEIRKNLAERTAVLDDVKLSEMGK